MSDYQKYLNKNVKTTLISATVDSIIDGDTIDVKLADDSIRRIRLGSGVNAPESYTDAGKMSAAYTSKLVPPGSSISLVDFADDSSKISEADKSYDRWPYPVVTSDGKLLDVELLKKGMADLSYLDSGYRAANLVDKDQLRSIYNNFHDIEPEVTTPEVKIEKIKNILKTVASEGWTDSSGKDIDGACKIGMIWLPVPPSSISVVEVNENEDIETIRTPGNPRMKTGKQDIRIQLELFFPSLHEINHKFRPLLAQFIRSPFLPIENEHIRKLVFPDVSWSSPRKSIRKNNVDQFEVNSTVYEREANKSMTKGTFTSLNEDDQNRIEKEMENRRNTVENNLFSLRKQLEDTTLSAEKRTTLESSVRYYYKMAKDINFLSKDAIAAQLIKNGSIDTNKTLYNDIQLVVALRGLSVSTVPGYPETLQCNLVLSVFNYGPYSDDFSFIKTLKDAMKQMEYATSKSNLQYPQAARDLLKLPVYKSPGNIQTTKNLSESEPFAAYIYPLLTGNNYITNNIEFEMEDVANGKTNITSGFGFIAPDNYIREVTNVSEFKKISMEYEISELNQSEKLILETLEANVSADIQGEFNTNVSKYFEKSILTQYEQSFSYLFDKLKKVLSFYFFRERLNLMYKAINDKTIITITPPLRLTRKIKNKEGKFVTENILNPNQLYTADEFLMQLKKLEGMDRVIKTIQDSYNLSFLKTYGYQNVYKLNFTEDDDTVITGMVGSYDTKMATLPILSYTLPTMQCMGRNNWNLEITIQTCNDALMRILRSLSDKANESRILRMKSNKDWWINRLNSIYFNPNIMGNGFFKLLGINHCLFDTATFEQIKERPGWFNVNLKLVQTDVDLFYYESLLPVNFYDQNIIDALKKCITDNYKWSKDTAFAQFSDQYKYLSRYIIPSIRSYVYRNVFNVFYGGNAPEMPGSNIQNDDSYITNELATKNGYMLSDIDVTNIVKSGIDPKKMGNILYKKFLTLPEASKSRYEKIVEATTGPIIDWSSQFSAIGISILNPFSSSATTENSETQAERSAYINTISQGKPTRTLYNGERLSASDFFLKMNNTFKIFGFFIDMKSENTMLQDYFLQTLVVKYLISSPNEAAELLKNNGYNYSLTDVHPKWNYTTQIQGKDYNLYSNYMDLELPAYTNGILSTPADFFYKKFDKVFPFENLEDRIKNAYIKYSEAWKYQFIDGFKIADKIGPEFSPYIPLGDEDIIELQKELNQKITETEEIEKQIIKFRNPRMTAPTDIEITNQKQTRAELDAKLISLTKVKEKIRSQINNAKNVDNHQKERLDVIMKMSQAAYLAYDKNDVDVLTPEEKMQLVSGRSTFDIRQAMVFQQCAKLGALLSMLGENKNLINRTSSKDGSKLMSMPSSTNRLTLQTQELIAQIEMGLQTASSDLFGIVTPWSLDKTQDIIDRIRDTYDVYKAKDKTKNMERAFPTAKLFFIEEDSKQWSAYDDYYMYNAIEDISVVHSKSTASSLANIVVSNLSKNLTDPMSIYNNEAPAKQQSYQEQDIYSMYVREGTTIMIKGGFDNNTNNLDILFMGKIVSVNYGDKINIVAQGFGAELLEPINKGVDKKLGYCSPARTHGDVVMWAMSTIDGMEHFGSTTIFDKLGFTNTYAKMPFYSTQKMRVLDQVRSLLPLPLFFKFGVYDPRFENIYLPYSKLCMSPIKQNLVDMFLNRKSIFTLSKNIMMVMTGIAMVALVIATVATFGVALGVSALLSAAAWSFGEVALYVVGASTCSFVFANIYHAIKSKEVNTLFWNTTFDWVIPAGTTMWDLLQEVCLYHDDYITTVLPYNDFLPGMTRSTLYMGPREGVYKYTDFFDNPENIEKFRKSVDKRRSFINISVNKEERDNLNKEKERIDKIVKDLDTKRNERKPLSENEKVELNAALIRQTEINEVLNYYKDNQNDIDVKDFKENRLRSAKEVMKAKIARIKDDTMRKKISDEYNNLEQMRSTTNDTSYNKFIKTIDEYIKTNDPSIDSTIIKNKLPKDSATAEDYIGEYLNYKYGKYITPDEEDFKYNSFESTGVAWSINNPNDLMSVDDEGKKFVKFPGYRNVVNYHYIDSYSNIIENGIRASAEDVYNHILVKYDKDPSLGNISGDRVTEFWADDNIRGNNIRTLISEQRNIDPWSAPFVSGDWQQWKEFNQSFASKKLYGRLPRVYQVGYNVLANMMRPMYRGDITVIGMPYVKPYDIVYVNDYFNNIFGPIEVETVTHKFSAEGFTTTIIPNAVITYMNPGKVAELSFMQGLQLPFVGYNVLTTDPRTIIGSMIAGGAIGTGALLAMKVPGPWAVGVGGVAGVVATSLFSLSLWNWGIGKMMGRDIINICGLWMNGKPLVAGMEGAYKDNVTVHMMDDIRNLIDFTQSIQEMG